MRIAFLVIAGLVLAACSKPSAEETFCEKIESCPPGDPSEAAKQCAPIDKCYEEDIQKGGACEAYARLVDEVDTCLNALTCDCLTSGCVIGKCNKDPITPDQVKTAQDAAKDAGCGCFLQGG